MSTSIYKSAAGYTTLMAFYDDHLKRWPVPYTCLAVPTRYGDTHLIASGSPDNPPLVLVRGAGGNALLWAPAVSYLSRHFRTYAIDVIGESGKSAPNRPSYNGCAYGEWMEDVLDALKVERANMAGTSRGGWLVVTIARCVPQRIQRLIPMCAEGIAPTSLRFLLHMLPVLLAPGRATVTRLLRFLTPPGLPVQQYLVEERAVVYKTFRQSWKRPPMFTDDQLRQVRAPTLLLYGDQDPVYNVQAIRRRTARLPANFHVETIPNAGHVLDYDQPKVVSERMVKFLSEGS